jgi:4-carboxymuconolactone decarboxylase
MDECQCHEQGMKARRAVLGDTHADASLKNRDEFNEVFQDLLTRYAWGVAPVFPGRRAA